MSEGNKNAIIDFSRTGFPKLDTIDILVWTPPVVGRLCIVRCLVTSLALYPFPASGIPLVVKTKNVFRYCHTSLGAGGGAMSPPVANHCSEIIYWKLIHLK